MYYRLIKSLLRLSLTIYKQSKKRKELIVHKLFTITDINAIDSSLSLLIFGYVSAGPSATLRT